MRPDDLFHTGVVVDDLAAAQELLTTTSGRRWSPVTETTYPVETAAGRGTVTLRRSFSAEALPHRVELIETVPGTVWTPADSGIHHHGYWSGDVDADTADLVAAGAVLEVRARLRDGTTAWTCCCGPAGRVELVDRSLETVLLPGVPG